MPFNHARAAGLAQLGGKDIWFQSGGHRVRAHFWAAGAGGGQTHAGRASTIAILPGFTEFCEKYGAEATRFHAKGFNVLVIDWPGQGRSGHFGKNPLSVHCLDFDQHLVALNQALSTVGLADQKLVLFGHSMGGHLALRFAARHRDCVERLILSAPMMAPPVMPVWFVRLAAGLFGWLGLERFSPPFHRPWPLERVRHFHPDNVLTRDAKGYEAQFIWFDDAPDLRRSGPTIGWVNAAYRSAMRHTLNAAWLKAINVPVLAFVAGDERVVHAASTDWALACLPDARVIDFPHARHELTRELPAVTRRLWREVDGFLADL